MTLRGDLSRVRSGSRADRITPPTTNVSPLAGPVDVTARPKFGQGSSAWHHGPSDQDMDTRAAMFLAVHGSSSISSTVPERPLSPEPRPRSLKDQCLSDCTG
ncbi:hypothetical protein ElyMa_001205900 [Elysia marginata]|uniref:Uncharacterized protein n=1 Tax=Elysia marginata TaxID=1093978 RepID=A0AAV4I5Y1_9GAST|nr:hypothetical protein ElyMa_001205900 [Elysia marginata]